MKKAIKLLLMYLIFLITIVILGTVIYAVHLNIQNFIVGTDNMLFNNLDLLKLVFYVAYCALLLICPFVSYYRGKHIGGISQTIVYAVLVIFTWGALFPGLTLLNNFYSSKHSEYTVERNLTGGYFRPSGKNIYYFTRDFYSNPITFDDTTAVVINTEGNGSVTVEKIKDNPDFELYAAAKPYKDILIHNTFKKQQIPNAVDLTSVINYGKDNFGKGWTFYLGFCSFGLLLASVYALTNLFKWRLLNSTLVIIATISAFSFNSLCIAGKLDKLIHGIEKVGFISSLSSIFENPVLVIFNLLFSILFILAGAITLSVRNHKKRVMGR